jgi:hypothetical protein
LHVLVWTREDGEQNDAKSGVLHLVALDALAAGMLVTLLLGAWRIIVAAFRYAGLQWTAHQWRRARSCS